MAKRAPTPCRQPACPQLCRDGSGYCPTHKAQASGWNRPGRGSSHARGYGAQWRKARALVWARDRGLCQTCLRDGVYTAGAAVDHITPKSQGGTDNLDNLEVICRRHHALKTGQEAAAGRRGRGG